MPTYHVSIDTISDLKAPLYIKKASYFLKLKIRHRETLFHGKEFVIF